jgi:hypothetical protein
MEGEGPLQRKAESPRFLMLAKKRRPWGRFSNIRYCRHNWLYDLLSDKKSRWEVTQPVVGGMGFREASEEELHSGGGR